MRKILKKTKQGRVSIKITENREFRDLMNFVQELMGPKYWKMRKWYFLRQLDCCMRSRCDTLSNRFYWIDQQGTF